MNNQIKSGERESLRWRLILAMIIVLLLLPLIAIFDTRSSAVVSRGTGGVVVKTSHGPVQGEAEGGVLVFRGMRFAEAPSRRLRFHPPSPPKSWTEIRPALDFAPACPQLVEIDPTENNNSVMDEDCLAVNVWTPRADEKKRPVMVWIHGGANIDGSARNSWYDGTTLAERGGVVVVTLQYRLGAWGFLELSEIGGEEYAVSGNLGVLDQIAALVWVRDNIAQFGGDPDNVTLFGESAGSAAIARLMTIPRAKGLFHKAIMESGALGANRSSVLPKDAIAQRTKVTRAYMKLAGVDDIGQLQNLTMVQMRDAQKKLFETQFEDDAFGPVVDGIVLKERPGNVMAEGREANVPLLIGTLLDETRYWSMVEDLPLEQKPLDLLKKQVAAIAGSEQRAAEVIDTYRKDWPDSGDCVVHISTDLYFRLPSIRMAEKMSDDRHPVYMYLFTYQSTSTFRRYTSAHSMELPFVFGRVDDLDAIAFIGRDPRREQLASQVQRYWTNFAHTGDPNGEGVPVWPKYDASTRQTMELGVASHAVKDPYSTERLAWGDATPEVDAVSAILSENGDH